MFTDIHVHKCMEQQLLRREAMNLKESEGYLGGYGREDEGEVIQLFYNLQNKIIKKHYYNKLVLRLLPYFCV